MTMTKLADTMRGVNSAISMASEPQPKAYRFQIRKRCSKS